MIPPYTKEGWSVWVTSFIVHDNDNKSLRGTKGVTAVSLNEVGEVVDQKYFSFLLVPWAVEKYAVNYDEEANALKDMIVRHNSQLMVVGANCIHANRFWTYLWEVASKILEEN